MLAMGKLSSFLWTGANLSRKPGAPLEKALSLLDWKNLQGTNALICLFSSSMIADNRVEHLSSTPFKGRLCPRSKMFSGNHHWRGRLSAVDLLFKIGCFVKIIVFSVKCYWSELVTTTRSAVLILPLLPDNTLGWTNIRTYLNHS